MTAFSSAFSLAGKRALVTGCDRGIGQAIALGLAEAGADIIGVSMHMPAGGETEVAVQALGREYHGYQADFGKLDELQGFIKQVQADFPVIDILFNNAGIIRRAPAAEHSDEDWDAVLTINLDAPFRLARAIGGQMLKNGSGKIIFTASLLTFQGGINVPGYAATDNTAALRQDEERSAAILSRIPAGRWALPTDYAGPAVFLASAASDYVHGTILTVDGGWMGR